MLRARGVGFGYDAGPEALVSADLEVEAGEVVALLGPNGAGKSTLLRLLDGQLEPCTGTLERPAARTSEGRLAYGWAGEETPHVRGISARDEARFFARVAGLPRTEAENAVEGLLHRLGLAIDGGRPVAECSFGARRKLALVEALAHRPRLLLLDEPTVGLDARAREELVALLRERVRDGAAVVLASHDTSFVEEVASHVVFMAGGRTRGGGRPGELVSRLGAGARIRVTLEDPLAELEGGSGWSVVESGNPLVVHAGAGPGSLPDVLEAVVRAGGVVREVQVHPSDLAEAFRAAVGEVLPGPAAAPHTPSSAGPPAAPPTPSTAVSPEAPR